MASLPDWAANFIGIPYEPLGRERSGADCWGLIYIVLREQFGVEIPRYDGVGFEKGCDRRGLSEFMREHKVDWRPVEPGDERPGDVVLLRALGVPIHVGVFLAPGYMLHCESGYDSCVESFTSHKWRTRVEGIYRYAG